jgi:hypothetical protein
VAVTKQHKILYSRCEWVYGTKIIFARLSAAGRVRPTGRLPGAAAHVASLFLRWPNFFMQMSVKLTVQTQNFIMLLQIACKNYRFFRAAIFQLIFCSRLMKISLFLFAGIPRYLKTAHGPPRTGPCTRPTAGSTSRLT